MPTDVPHNNQTRHSNCDGGNSSFSFWDVPGDNKYASIAAAARSGPFHHESSSAMFPRITSRSRRLQAHAPGPSRATQQAEAEMGSGPMNSGETVSSRPNDYNSVRRRNVGSTRTDDDGDTLMSEARQDALD